MNKYENVVHPYFELWAYDTEGPTVRGVPAPLNMAYSIAQDSTYHPGIKCRNIVDAWKVFNTLKGAKYPKIPGKLPGRDGIIGTHLAREDRRVYDRVLWEAWHEGQAWTPRYVTLDEARDWPYYENGFLYGQDSSLSYATSLLSNYWYIEKETGAVYLDYIATIGVKYERKKSNGYWELFSISGRLGRPKKYKKDEVTVMPQRLVTWSTMIGDVPVECNASYYSWAPEIMPPEIKELTNFFKGITFTTL
jgi:hypothetical protein